MQLPDNLLERQLVATGSHNRVFLGTGVYDTIMVDSATTLQTGAPMQTVSVIGFAGALASAITGVIDLFRQRYPQVNLNPKNW